MRGDIYGAGDAELADLAADDIGYRPQLQRRMSFNEMVRTTALPWLAFVLSLSVVLLLYHQSVGLMWGILLFCLLLSVLALVLGSAGRHATLVTTSFLCLASLGLGSGIGAWLDAEYMHRFWELYDGAKYRTVNPHDAYVPVDRVTILHFVAGTTVDVARTLGFLAKGSIYCVAPVLKEHSTEEILYWAVGKDCCGRRASFSCGAFRQPDSAAAITEKLDGIFSKAVIQAASVYNIKAAPLPRLVSFVEHPAQVLAQIWHETFIIALLAVIMDLFVCLIATLTMASSPVYASKAKY
eukprot:TRINITY_DN70185_c0_g1_i1.p1 TRINITY_DN70185_c0_g1~~TRINITY_DN70185_c0_g1_i1.p1  ORF type:complete len:296 (+),score=66.87 TRINITY_DN70185_c0_g1_i1:80-967(+)